MDLFDLYNSIEIPTENDDYQFSAISIPGYENHKIAKDKFNKPVLLLFVSNKKIKLHFPNIRLKNIFVQFNVSCSIKDNHQVTNKIFTLISFTGEEDSLKKYFLRLCAYLINNLKNNPSLEDIKNEVNKFIDLFSLVNKPQLKSVQGLWAELLLITESHNPSDLIRAWHNYPEEKFDFNIGEKRIEVKSTSSSQRIHSFSIDQLNPPKDTEVFVASIFVKQASLGYSIETLCHIIEDKISNNIDLLDKVHHQIALTLGKAIEDFDKIKFDYHLAKDSLLFYNSIDIPKIKTENIPLFISNVKFNSDLSSVLPILYFDF